MQIRRATTGDIRDAVNYMVEYHENSNLSDIPVNRRSITKIVQFYIEHKGHLPLIAVEKGEVIGVLFGSLEPYFFNEKRYYATDLMFFSKGAGPQLWRAFRDWAFEMGADRLIMGVSSGDQRASQLLEALGMEKTGGMYVLREASS